MLLLMVGVCRGDRRCTRADAGLSVALLMRRGDRAGRRLPSARGASALSAACIVADAFAAFAKVLIYAAAAVVAAASRRAFFERDARPCAPNIRC